jgi:uroporphyrinogen decarboxylase
MRQAGRYMPEYRKLREKYTLLEMVAQPELAAEVTLQPIKAFKMDAAILFADILLPLKPMGVNFEFVKGKGPQVENPVRTAEDVAALKPVDTEASLGHVMEAIRILRGELNWFLWCTIHGRILHDRRWPFERLSDGKIYDV